MRASMPAPIARIAPDLASGIAVGVASNAMLIWPPTRSVSIGAEPRYGPGVMLRPPASDLHSSPHRCRIEPTPEEPKVYLPGLALTSAIRLARSVTGSLLLTPSSVGVTPTRAIGVKSRIGSYGMRL